MACSFAAQRCSLQAGSQRLISRPVFSVVQHSPAQQQRSRRRLLAVSAVPGQEEDEMGANKQLTRETEPDKFWQTPAEAKGQNPIKDPMAIVGILGLLSPFVILGVAIAMGAVDVSEYRGR